jgi:hypothetical protein
MAINNKPDPQVIATNNNKIILYPSIINIIELLMTSHIRLHLYSEAFHN